jgi:hypothetical protein
MCYYSDPYAVRGIIYFRSENITKRVNNTDCRCLRGKYLGKFFYQLKRIMVIGELKKTSIVLDELIKHRYIINYNTYSMEQSPS